jgi:hypothetical protein
MEKNSQDQTTAEVVAEVVHRAKADLDVVVTAVANASRPRIGHASRSADRGRAWASWRKVLRQ